MSFNPSGATEIPLAVFGGLVTEQVAPSLPAGASPDNFDVVYRPGSVRSRPGLSKQLVPPLPANPTVTYGKSYVDPKGVVRNLYLDSNGQLYYELLSNPGVAVPLLQSTPGTYAKSITAFGREYIAISDGLHGQEVPLQYDGTNLDRVTQDGPGAPPTVTSHSIHSSAAASVVRASNIVTVTTAAPHGLQVGYLAQLVDLGALAIGGGIASIVIDNEGSPGIATVTTVSAHGLVPDTFVSIGGVTAATVGTSIVNATRQGQVVTLLMTTTHKLSVGASITVVGTSDVTFLGSFTVTQIPDAHTLVYIQAEPTNVNASAVGGTVSINWPLPSVGINSQLEVLSTPSTTEFQVAVSYSDGTWTTGFVTLEWNGTFFVATVPSTTVYTYQQFGPDATVIGNGTVNPIGQIAPGQHQVQVLFLTRQGAITEPSPPVKFYSPGGQYLTITNIPLGPPNVVARILAFTGADGAYFFYIPVPAQVNKQIVSTATQINDNTTQTVLLDFSDNTLFASLGISIPGNDLANQIVLDGALGFGFYGSRLLAYGQRNKIQNLLNMGFDGGIQQPTPTIPPGWTPAGGGGALAAGRFSGLAWSITTPGTLSQGMYQDAYGAPIAQSNTQYKLRVWLQGGGSFTATISSSSTGFSATATVPTAAAAGGWFEATFSAKTPATIPADLSLTIQGVSVLIDELSIIYSDTPYLDTLVFGSYVDNPEGFDGVTGKFGPTDDTRKIMDFGIIRRNLYVLTQDPTGRIHVTSDNGVTEPSGWEIDEVAANCGVLSAFSLTKSQADDSSASGGEEWFAWASLTGARLFAGSEPWKISQEIQPDWDSIHLASQLTIWALNDPVTRQMYFGVPLCPGTAPTVIYVLNYRGLETAYDIAMAMPVRVGFGGKLIATDKARKWTRWRRAMNGAALMYRPAPLCA